MRRRAKPKRKSPLSIAFTTSAAAIVLLTAGTLGYSLSHGFFQGNWTDGIVWWEIRLGALFGLLAIYFWRKGLQELS